MSEQSEQANASGGVRPRWADMASSDDDAGVPPNHVKEHGGNAAVMRALLVMDKAFRDAQELTSDWRRALVALGRVSAWGTGNGGGAMPRELAEDDGAAIRAAARAEISRIERVLRRVGDAQRAT